MGERKLTDPQDLNFKAAGGSRGKVFTGRPCWKRCGYEFAGDTRTVDVHIRHLRQKLGEKQAASIRRDGERSGI